MSIGAMRAGIAAAIGDRKGVAATEFALLLPIMTVLFFGMLEASDALTAARRVGHAANAFADLVGQEKEITKSELDDLIVGVTRMLKPTTASGVSMKVVSVIRDPDTDKAVVSWSRDNSGGAPYANGERYPKIAKSLVNKSASLIVVEMSYDYASGLTSQVLGSTFHFDRIVSRWPRQSDEVALCGNSPLPACEDNSNASSSDGSSSGSGGRRRRRR